jgi:endonuclease YncB( thermonuclease family)
LKFKRKFFAATLALGLILGIAPVASANIAPPEVFIDGKRIAFEVPPTIVDGSTLVPMRKIFEELGSDISWNADTRTVTAIKGETVIEYSIGQPIARKNSDTISLSVPGVIIDGSTMMPLRFVGEALGATVGWEGNSRTISISSARKLEAKVSQVLDGDTIEVISVGIIDDSDPITEKIRMIGIDTPETIHPNKPVQKYGKEASDFTKAQLMGTTVFIEVDVEKRDRYGRVLAYVYTEDGEMFNAKLIAEGYGQAATFPPNVRWVEFFKSLQKNARDLSRGLWSDVDSVPKSVSIGDIAITEVDVEGEKVTITNYGSTDVNLRGWKLLSVTEAQTYNFKDEYDLKAGTSVTLLSGSSAAAGEGKLLWTTANIWNNTTSDPAELYDSTGALVSTHE